LANFAGPIALKPARFAEGGVNLNESSFKKRYIYADRQILAQHDIDEDDEQDDKYFYMHDRLGSVRLVIDDSGDVVNYYTYEPFGEAIDTDVTLDNPFMFTGQYYDAEIEEYYLRARQYNPQIARFTAREGSENPDEFSALSDDLNLQLQPKVTLEDMFVEKIAVAYWRLRRAYSPQSASFPGPRTEKTLQFPPPYG